MSAVYSRHRHAAHYAPGASVPGHDLESWDSVQAWGDPRPAAVPANAERHHGYRDKQGRQHVVFVRTAPWTPDPNCPTCARRAGGGR